MNCRCAQNLLSAYVDGELAGVEMLRLREHLGVCPACREEVEALRAMKRLLSRSPQVEPPAGFEDRLAAIVLTSDATRHRPGTPIWRLALTTSLAAATIVFVLLQVMRPSPASNGARTAPADVAFDVQSDQSYMATSDPFGGQAPVMPVSQK
ncbi:MAG TPA: anti-sigma factor [Fimbriimonadaceae bacterium]|nr:anti-sigma factor [Fimbriimonadaceae bacterium]